MKNIESILAEKKIFVGKTEGCSMNPMLVEGRDTVVIVPPEFPLKKYDVPVYRRDDHYTMHRIVKVTKKGYVICGDNLIRLEKDITDRDIVGVLTAFYQDGKFVECTDRGYLKYARRIVRNYPVRYAKFLLGVLKRKIKKILQ